MWYDASGCRYITMSLPQNSFISLNHTGTVVKSCPGAGLTAATTVVYVTVSRLFPKRKAIRVITAKKHVRPFVKIKLTLQALSVENALQFIICGETCFNA